MMFRRISILIIASLLLLSDISFAEDGIELFVINVRKADCMLLQSGDDVYMIDAGTEQSWGQISTALHTRGIDHLKGVIFTHTHRDHTGCASILAQSDIVIDAWYSPRWYADVKESKHPVILAAAMRGQQVTWLEGDDTLTLQNGMIKILGPVKESDVENCNSLVLLVQGEGCSMLLTGDMEFPQEEDLIRKKVLSPVTVLKVANHGESDATSEAFIREVKPQIAVISTNTDDEPDTPSGRVLKLLRKAQSRIAITQNAQAGISVILKDGQATCSMLNWQNIPELKNGLQITAKNNKQQTVTISNKSDQPKDLSGSYIISERGYEIYVFPKGTTLNAGESITVVGEDSQIESAYIWPQKKVWHKSKSDAAILYDAYGRQLSRME